MIDNNVSFVRVSGEAQGQVDQLRWDDPITWFLRTASMGFAALAQSLSQIRNVRRTCPARSLGPQISFPMGFKEGETKSWIMKTFLHLPL